MMGTREYPELCRRCGATLAGHRLECRISRLCPTHLHEARQNCPPFACSPDDIDSGDRGECEQCGHLHMPGVACTQLTAKLAFSYGEVVEDTPPHACGCRA